MGTTYARAVPDRSASRGAVCRVRYVEPQSVASYQFLTLAVDFIEHQIWEEDGFEELLCRKLPMADDVSLSRGGGFMRDDWRPGDPCPMQGCSMRYLPSWFDFLEVHESVFPIGFCPSGLRSYAFPARRENRPKSVVFGGQKDWSPTQRISDADVSIASQSHNRLAAAELHLSSEVVVKRA